MLDRRIWPLLCLAYWPIVSSAALDPTDVIQIQATGSLVHDSNLFRLPDDLNPTSDTTRVLGLGLKLDKTISRQRLIGDLSVNDAKYNRNSNLDHVGGDGRLAWMWQVGNYWSGEASYRKQRTLAGFADFRLNVKDLIDNETYRLSGGYQFHPRWRVAADFSDQDVTHSADLRRTFDYMSKATGLSLTYRTPAANTAGLQLRRTERDYPNRQTVGVVAFDNSHTEDRIEATAVWWPTGLLRLDGKVGYVDLHHDLLSARDFSGVIWRAIATWEATGKTRIAVTASRDVRLYEDLATSFIVVNAFGVTPTYAISSKVIVHGDFSYEDREYRGNPGFVVASFLREDKVRLARLGVTYTPIRNIDLILSYEVGDRRSNVFTSNFDYRTWLGTLRIGF